jgi:hypothetical protein
MRKLFQGARFRSLCQLHLVLKRSTEGSPGLWINRLPSSPHRGFLELGPIGQYPAPNVNRRSPPSSSFAVGCMQACDRLAITSPFHFFSRCAHHFLLASPIRLRASVDIVRFLSLVDLADALRVPLRSPEGHPRPLSIVLVRLPIPR